MEIQTVKQKSPVSGSVLLIIGAVITALLSVIDELWAISNLLTALSLPDNYAMPIIINSISIIASDLARNLLGLMPILCIVIAILAIMKKKGLPMLIASALMAVFTISGLFGTIGAIIMGYAGKVTQLVSYDGSLKFTGIFDLLIMLNDYIIAPLTSLACAISLVIMWFMFIVMVLACADGKLGFLRKIKKVVSVLFTVSAILVLACFAGSLVRYIVMDLIVYYAMLTTVYGVSLPLTGYGTLNGK